MTVPAKQRIPAVETLSEQSNALFEVINNEPDLACVLVGTSYLDQCLASLLERYLIESKVVQQLLSPQGGPVGTLSSRAELCYCLGLIPKSLYTNLQVIGEIRNRFAHSHLHLTFADPDVMRLCESLTFLTVAGVARVERGQAQEVLDPFSQFTGARERFSIIVVLMVNRLLLTGLSTQHRLREVKGWA